MKIIRSNEKKRYMLSDVPAGDLFLLNGEMFFKTENEYEYVTACYSVRTGAYRGLNSDISVEKIKSITYEVEE